MHESDADSVATAAARFDALVQTRVRDHVPPVPGADPRLRPSPEAQRAEQEGAMLAAAEPEVASRLEAYTRAELRPSWSDRDVRMVALKAMHYTVMDIARDVRVPLGTVRRVLAVARRDGLLEDVESRMMHEAVPLAVENVIEALKAGDTDMSLEVLKGRGVFKSHSAGKAGGESAEPRSIALIVKVEHQTSDGGRVVMASGAVVSGAPRALGTLSHTPVIDTELVDVPE